MNRERLTKEWLGKICKILEMKNEIDDEMIPFEDCAIYTFWSPELQRTYRVFHVVGQDVDFILKRSNINEAVVLRNLNLLKERPRLKVPEVYQTVEGKNIKTGVSFFYIAMEHIKRNEEAGKGSCENQVDGLLSYQGGENLAAWESTGFELARIHNSLWGTSPLEGIPYEGEDYNKTLLLMEGSKLMQRDHLIHKMFEIAKDRCGKMPICLENQDMLPINVLIKERNYIREKEKIIRPQAYFVDWALSRPAPYILDLARLISHCHRVTVVDMKQMNQSPQYCTERCKKAVIEEYYKGISEHVPDREEFEKDLLCGIFFEKARMFIQMPYFSPIDSYDRFYYQTLREAAGDLQNAFLRK